MGVYLNSKKPYALYKKIAQSVYFVDKTAMLNELIPIVDQDDDSAAVQTGDRDLRYICITRPRRFEKCVPLKFSKWGMLFYKEKHYSCAIKTSGGARR